ncbi:MAG: hypothetical protein ACO3PV_08595 [Pseudohongiellaceae bacterium]
MQTQLLPQLARWIPLALLGSLPVPVGAAEQFFPVLLDSGTHWYSFFEHAPKQQTSGELVSTEDNDLMPYSYPGMLKDHARPLGAYEKLEQQYFLARVARGLHHEAHIPLLREMAELALRNGDVQRAHELREALLNLSLRVFGEDDPGRIEAHLEWADWQLQCYLEATDTFMTVPDWSQNPWFNPYFIESDLHYRQALRKLDLRQALPIATRVSLLAAMRKWQTLHIVAARQRPLQKAHGHGLPGSGITHGLALGQQPVPLSYISYLTESLLKSIQGATELQGQELQLQVAQLVLMGDWLHAIGLPEQAQHSYADAHRLLAQSTIEIDQAERLLGPGLPVPDPEQWYRSGRRVDSFRHYIDAELTLDTKGRLIHAEFPGAEKADSGKLRSLQRTLAASRFRPLPGAAKSAPTVRLRFYHD